MKISWSEAIAKTQKWETRYPWIERFRLTYYFDQQRDWKGKLRMRIVYLLQRNQLQLTILLSLLRPKKQFSKADYLFILTSNPAYLNCLIPILATLKSQGKSIRIFTPNWERNKVVKRLQKEGLGDIELFTESDWGGQGVFKWLYASFSSSFAALWFLINSNTRFIQRNSFFQFAFLEKYFGNAVTETLEAHQHLIAAADHWMWESFFFYHAKSADNNSIVVQHGFIADFCVPFLCKKYAVWGEFDKELMLQRGVDERELLIAGAPHFDAFAQKHGANFDKSEKQYITFFAQPYFKYPYLGEGKYQASLLWLNSLAIKAKELGKTLQIRLHPLDNKQAYTSLLPTIKIAEGSLSDNISESCLALTIDSAVAFECGMAHLPVVQLSNEFDRFMDMSEHYSLKASSETKLIEIVTKLLAEKSSFENEQKRQEAGLCYYLANPGQASRKIIEYCE
jgi:hypothetical protein